MLTNTEVVKTLINAKTYAKAVDLVAFDYAVAVLSKLEAQGINDPLNYNFAKNTKENA